MRRITMGDVFAAASTRECFKPRPKRERPVSSHLRLVHSNAERVTQTNGKR